MIACSFEQISTQMQFEAILLRKFISDKKTPKNKIKKQNKKTK